MNLRLWMPVRRRIPDSALVGLAERANKRLGVPLQNAVDADELLLQAELDGLVDPRPEGACLDSYHDYRYGRSQLVKLARRRASLSDVLRASIEHERRKREGGA